MTNLRQNKVNLELKIKVAFSLDTLTHTRLIRIELIRNDIDPDKLKSVSNLHSY